MAPLEKTRQIIKKLPEQKPHLDLIAALLTIPVLITVLLINLGNINNKKVSTQPASTPVPSVQTAQNTQSAPRQTTSKTTVVETTVTPNLTPDATSCIKGIGQIDVTYPQEGQVVSDNPLCISINYIQGDYCSVVWAYKINNGNFSDYSNNSVCLYNIPSGDNTFTLQVKSLVNTDTKTIERHFGYKNTQVSITPSPTLNPSITP
jgi:hypothetical protein